MAKDETYKDYLRALKSATESTKSTKLTKAYNKALGSFPLVKNKTETKSLLGLKDLTTENFLKRRSILSGASNALAKAGKKTAIGRIADTILKIGSGAGAGYAYAKKDEIKKKDVKKAKDGVMTDAQAKSKAYNIRRAYNLAQANKGEDRITQSDVREAEKALEGMDVLSASRRDRAKVKKAKDGMMITKGGDYIKDLL